MAAKTLFRAVSRSRTRRGTFQPFRLDLHTRHLRPTSLSEHALISKEDSQKGVKKTTFWRSACLSLHSARRVTLLDGLVQPFVWIRWCGRGGGEAGGSRARPVSLHLAMSDNRRGVVIITVPSSTLQF